MSSHPRSISSREWIVNSPSLLSMIRRPRLQIVLILASSLFMRPAGSLEAGKAVMENGQILEGTLVPIMGLSDKTIRQNQGPVPNYPILMVDTGMKWYFVPGRRVAESVPEATETKYEIFEIKQTRTGRSLTPSSLGAYLDIEDFTEHGRRTVTIKTDRGPVPIVQGITKLTPQYVWVEGITHVWEHGIATTSFPNEILDPILRQVTDQANPLDRLAIARFYLQGGMYLESERELSNTMEEFPDYRERVEEMFRQLQELTADRFLNELNRREAAGQYRLVQTRAREFPAEKMSAEVQRRVRELLEQGAERTQRQDDALLRLSNLHAKIADPQLNEALAPLRSTVRDQMNPDSLPRLDAFFTLADAEDLSTEQKLALAYSGWILGSTNAIDDLSETIRLWQGQFLVLEYMRTRNSLRHRELLEELSNLEGVSADRVLQMIPLLPMIDPPEDVTPGIVHTMTASNSSEELPIRYSVVLPHEYQPHRSYPLIVELHPAERTASQQIVWWSGTPEQPGQSQRQGYIVIAPEYLLPEQKEYDYDVRSHRIVLESIRDARRRFHIDSDRVFLAGHGTGGDAAFDIGMSHPSEFTGVIPICGISDRYCTWYWPNCEKLPLYVVGGELDRNSFEHNAYLGQLNRMMKLGFDVTYAVYIGRGYDSYYEEIHQIFDWMDRYRRPRNPVEIDAKSIRPSDSEFYWLSFSGLPRAVLQSGVLTGDQRRKTSPMAVSARVTPGNTISLTSGAASHSLWLSPDFVNFDERVTVRFKGRTRFNDFVRPELETLLEDFRVRSDRQRIYQARIDL